MKGNLKYPELLWDNPMCNGPIVGMSWDNQGSVSYIRVIPGYPWEMQQGVKSHDSHPQVVLQIKIKYNPGYLGLTYYY